MDIRYAIMAATGVNDPSKTLPRPLEPAAVRDTFADAKAEVITRADALLEYLASTDRNYAMHVESRDQHFEVRFEYGPASPSSALPFLMVLKVYPCTIDRGHIEPIDSDACTTTHQRETRRRSLAARRSDCSGKDGRRVESSIDERHREVTPDPASATARPRSRQCVRPFPV